jgi:hypothetical protein
MIRAQELRIGNWVEYDNRYFQIDSIADVFPTLNTPEFGIGVVDYNNIKPIPLTEEWLLKFGFKLLNKKYRKTGFLHCNKIWFPLTVRFYCHGIWVEYFGQQIGEIKYVHQLQNIYFAIEKEELKLQQ